ncbi:MAG: alpha/beta fold hydrolase [Candidatus Moranbacteria bacterium]|nr:alpha/beta fold hydrolase [Candidatus Moranbacteria bacterium]MDD3964557.1 alpha/beta fold hydrolase [Candidatus Moranbacteria bacterium]
MIRPNRLKFFTWRRMVLRFFYPLWVFFSSRKKVDAINENSIRAASATDGVITILLHGIFTNYYSAPYWAIRWLKSNGIQVVSLGYDYWADAETAATQIKNQIDAIIARTGVHKINIIGISLGGGVARYYVEKLGGKDVVEKLVTIFTPIGTRKSGKYDIAFLMNKLVSSEGADISKKQTDAIAHSFSAKNHLAIYGTSDWIVGSQTYPLSDAPLSVTQVPVAGGHLLVSYNTDALELALGYILDTPLSEIGVPIPTSLSFVTENPLPIIRQCVQSFQSQATEKGLKLELLNTKEAEIRINEPGMNEILTNLIGNAIKYTAEGSVSVTTDIRDNQYVITVADTGFGISASNQKKLFQKFARIQNAQTQSIPGTGLGLWVSLGLAKRMGGTIDVESIEGVGSHFVFSLPLTSQ